MISVCMATYNGSSYIQSQIESILPQLEEGDELLISDDGSSDGTLEIICQYLSQNPNTVRLLMGPQKGLIKNFEFLINEAKGDLIFTADQDDVWLPDKVEKIKYFFEQEPNALVVVSDLIVVDADLNQLATSYFEMRSAKSGFLNNLIKNYYIGAGMAFKRELKEIALPFPSRIPMHDMWLGLLGGNKTYLLHESLTKYRRHSDNQSEIETTSSLTQKVIWRISIVSAMINRKILYFFRKKSNEKY